MQQPGSIQKLAPAALIATSVLVILVGAIWGIRLLTMVRSQPAIQPANNAIGGFPMTGDLAPDFALTDQFGHSVTLASLRGHEVVLAFIDSRCTSLCPLTANIMYNARAKLGSAAVSQIVLVAVNANPTATSVAEVQDWSIKHGMLHQWLFLTGSAKQLESVYHMYNVYVQVDSSGNVVHDSVMLVLDAAGHERLYFETLDSNSKTDLSDEIIGLQAGMKQWLPQPQ
ncbi:MAG TPA: SCO family protein [Ktedonobacteraceae bacterium]|nr:SCO family protein [Ktedonobacteraceae bacterium]